MKKKILVTGADGFIGSHLVEMLVKDGYQVRAMSLYNSFNNWGWLEDIDLCTLADSVEVLSGDIRDPYFCDKAVKDVNSIIHLASLISIPYSYIAPLGFVETNVVGTLNMCEAAIKHNCEKFIHTSTSEVYGSANYVPIDEKHPLQPQSPYSASKIAADQIALSYKNSFQLPVIVARPFNTYGPRQSARAVIPTIITQLATGSKHIKLGDLQPTRDFTFVHDTCRAFVELLKSSVATGEIYNIGSNFEISIGDIFYKIRNLMNVEAEIIFDGERKRPDSSEVLRLFCNNQKLYQATKFLPKINLDDGLLQTVEWFMKDSNLKKFKPGIYNV